MKPYRQTRAEQETTIRWNEDDKVVHVWSASPVTWRKMARLGLPPVRGSVIDGHEAGRFYRVPLSRFRWGLKSETRAESGRQRAAQGPPAFQKRRVAGASGSSGARPAT